MEWFEKNNIKISYNHVGLLRNKVRPLPPQPPRGLGGRGGERRFIQEFVLVFFVVMILTPELH
jgi:hypothetical protein